jgi:hypothetical protein
MSGAIRQSNLFSAEDYRKVFKAYAFIDYTAYDFDTLKQALINYIQAYYPEDFNDYIESSEFIAIIELLAYFGTSLAFRTDLNSRENFIDTATRRESIIRLAQMVNYVPRRNIPASGLFKIAAVQTDQPLTDANGININDTTVYWNDPNNPDWFDQFTQICNAAFSTLNPFGRPTKSGVIGSIPTDLYQLNNILQLNVTYVANITINGQVYPIDICNPNFITNETIFERDPDPANAFNFIYRNDSLGVSSANTGFFLYFKQGNLINIDTNFEFPVPNRLFPIDIQNINQTDVYVQETDQTGAVINKWLKVPALAGENIIYNSIQFGERNIFDVISGANDTVTLRFADGNFGNIPTGLFRTWVRVSANQALVIRPADAQGLQINIPYIGFDQQQYTLRITFNLEQTIGNAAAAETDEQIKLRAPEVFSTQSRMVNGSDYNVLPLVYGNQISKLQAIDRTYSGQSRYIDLNDPTGFHKDLIIFGEDGTLYRDNQNILTEVIRDSSNTTTIDNILANTIQEMLRDNKVSTFFYDSYIPQFEETVRVNPPNTGRSLLDLVPTENDPSASLYWSTSPLKFKNDTGYFTSSQASDAEFVSLVNTPENIASTAVNEDGGIYQAWKFIQSGAVLEFSSYGLADRPTSTASVNTVISDGKPSINSVNPYANIGPVELSIEENDKIQAVKVYPIFRNVLTKPEIVAIKAAVNAGISFYLYYDALKDSWGVSTTSTPNIPNQAAQPFKYPKPQTVDNKELLSSDWASYPNSGMLYVAISSNDQVGSTTFSLTARGRAFIFESYRDVRFYWEPNQVVIDSASGLALQDNIEIMPFINTNRLINNNEPIITDPAISYLPNGVVFNLTGVYTQDDGYVDTSKIAVSLVDINNDGIPDNPRGFNNIVSPSDRVVFELYTNEITGYQNSRPWICNWDTVLRDTSADNIYVYFPVDPNAVNELYGSPYIANMELTTQYDILNPSSVAINGFKYVYMDVSNLIFINNISQIEFNSVTPATITIANQLSAFFNDTGIFPWMTSATGNDTQRLTSKNDILTNYFYSKVFLIYETNSEINMPGFGIYYTLASSTTLNTTFYPTGTVVLASVNTSYFDKNGKTFTQNTSVRLDERLPLYFKWSHYAPIDQRVDPSATNIIDMIVITDSYYRDMVIWKNSNGTLLTQPVPPTTEELRIQFQDLNQYKMISDDMVWNSGSFKILFGTQAATELQATFKVVKSPSTNISDNEVKTKVVQSIDAYFDIRNWDFGETFFYTELAAFIHQQLSLIISTVVIVPNNANSQFGNLFEIISSPSELFMSTATVNNVQIVSNLTEQNLRV